MKSKKEFWGLVYVDPQFLTRLSRHTRAKSNEAKYGGVYFPRTKGKCSPNLILRFYEQGGVKETGEPEWETASKATLGYRRLSAYRRVFPDGTVYYTLDFGPCQIEDRIEDHSEFISVHDMDIVTGPFEEEEFGDPVFQVVTSAYSGEESQKTEIRFLVYALEAENDDLENSDEDNDSGS